MKSKNAFLPCIIWATAVAFYCFQYFLRISVSGLEPELVRNLHISAMTLSSVAAAFFYAYIIMQIPSGLLIDRYGPRLSLTISSFTCTVGALIFISSNHPYVLIIGRIFMGMGACFAFGGALTLGRSWFSAQKFSLLNSLMVIVGTIGAIMAGFPLADLAHEYGWLKVMEFAGIAGLIIVCMSWFIIRDSPDKGPKKKTSKQNSLTTFMLDSLKIVCADSRIWLLGCFAGLIWVPIGTFGALWCTPFLKALYGADQKLVPYAVPFMFIGTAIGSLIYAKLGKSVERNIRLMQISALATSALLMLILFATLFDISIYIMFVLVFFLGIFMSSMVLTFIMIKDFVPNKQTATAISMVNMLQQLFGAIMLPLIGLILDYEIKGKVVGNLLHYTIKDFHMALIVVPVCTIFSFFITYSLRKKL